MRLSRAGLSPLLILALGACVPAPREKPFLAVDGIIDLREAGPSFEVPIDLEGEWRFYPARFLSPESPVEGSTFRSVPDFWDGAEAGGKDGQGYGTYRLTILLPPGSEGMGIRCRTVSTSFELYAGDRVIARAGRPGTDRASSEAAYGPVVAALPDELIARDAKGLPRLELTMRVSNYEYRSGGLWRSLSIGSFSGLAFQKRLADFLSFVQASFLAAIALTAFFMFLLRHREPGFLSFSAFALLIALRALVTGEYVLTEAFPDIPFELLIKLEYMTAYMPIPIGALFFIRLFPVSAIRTKRVLALTAPAAAFILLIPLAPLPVLTRSILWYYPVALATIGIVFTGIALPAARDAKPGARAMLAAFIVLALSCGADMLFQTFVLRIPAILPFALTAFVLAQGFILSKRLIGAFEGQERLAGELGVANARLQDQIDRYQAEARRSESLLAEKDALVKEMHHRVKNSLQIVSSVLKLQANRDDSPGVKRLCDSLSARIKAISLAHEKLHGTGSAESVDLAAYLRDLAERLSQAYGIGPDSESLVFDLAKADVPMGLCIDIGLAVAELATNAFRHAVIPSKGGRVELHSENREGAIAIVVSDDGRGFPPGFDPRKIDSLGFKIVSSMVKKHGGSVTVLPSDRGACVELVFPLGESGEAERALLTGQGPEGET